jgi:hypothetical protein
VWEGGEEGGGEEEVRVWVFHCDGWVGWDGFVRWAQQQQQQQADARWLFDGCCCCGLRFSFCRVYWVDWWCSIDWSIDFVSDFTAAVSLG